MSSPTIPQRERSRTHSSSSSSRPRTGLRASFRSDRSNTGTEILLEGESEWEEGSEEFDYSIEKEKEIARKKKKKDEPASPIQVVLYVVFVYIIWQILTRTDDHEILSHLPGRASSLLSNHHLDLPHLNYPYHIPHIPSPLPSMSTVTHASESSTSLWRVIFGILAYPFWLIYTVLTSPLPFLVIILNYILDIILVILSPFTLIGKALFETFIRGPWSVFTGVMKMLYPVWVFVGGVLGVGTVLGLAVGWIGRSTLNWLISVFHGRKKRKHERRRRSSKHPSSSGENSRRSKSEYTDPSVNESLYLSTNPTIEKSKQTKTSPIPDRQHSYLPIIPSPQSNDPTPTRKQMRHTPNSSDEIPIRTPAASHLSNGFTRSSSSSTARKRRESVQFEDDEDGGYEEDHSYSRSRGEFREPVVVGVRRRYRGL